MQQTQKVIKHPAEVLMCGGDKRVLRRIKKLALCYKLNFYNDISLLTSLNFIFMETLNFQLKNFLILSRKRNLSYNTSINQFLSLSACMLHSVNKTFYDFKWHFFDCKNSKLFLLNSCIILRKSCDSQISGRTLIILCCNVETLSI